MNDYNLKTLKPKTLLDCAFTEELAAIRATTRVNYKGSTFFLPLPFLQDAVLNADTTEPLGLILIAVAAAKEFGKSLKMAKIRTRLQ